MIEAPCAACGTLNRIAEADVPAGAKFVTCSSCKSRVPLPVAKPAGIPAAPRPPSMPVPKVPPKLPSAKPTADIADLPAPKRTSPLALTDLPTKPAPKSGLAAGDADLPAPKPPGEIADLPAPKSPAAIADLPTPKTTAPGIVDLPKPRATAAITDLPAPKPKPPARPISPLAKPPAAKPGPPAIVDLPAPKSPGLADLPAPRTSVGVPETSGLDLDLPAPVGDIVDLPTPKPGSATDLPAPKGFFDDLPQPALTNKPGGIDLPAPKGFFDDLPQPARQQPAAKPELPAPKGFFDDLPQPALTNKPATPELPAPKGFFDDLPQPALTNKPAAPPPSPAGSLDVELGGPGAGAELELAADLDKPLELDRGPAFELDLPAPSAPQSPRKFAELDLQEPSKAGIKIAAPKPGAKPAAAAAAFAPVPVAKSGRGELKLELEGEQPVDPAGAAKQAPVKKPAAAVADPADRAAKRKRSRAVLTGLLAVVLVGAGGFYFYQRHQKQVAAAAEVARHVAAARAALVAGDPQHWQHAANEANAALEHDDKNAAALGIGAEAMLAGALDTGFAAQVNIQRGKGLIEKANAASRTGPELERANALALVAANQPGEAVKKLQGLSARAPKDGFLLLYLGWAQLANGDPAAALKSFEAAIAATPNVKLPATYGLGRTKLALADIAGAKADFAAVLAIKNDHIGAMVGLAQARPPSEAAQRESDLLAIFQRKDIAAADPRAVVEAWDLAADIADRGGRLDVARDRYNKALAITPLDVDALLGLAGVELQDHKVEAAKELITKAVAEAPDAPEVKLALALLDVAGGKLPDAAKIVQELSARTPPLPPLLHARLELITGKLREAQGDDEGAVDAYEQGAKDAGELELAPTMAAVEKLTALAKKATDNKDDAKAKAYRQRASDLLAASEARAKEDEQLSVTLGVAYLQAGDAAKAEALLRAATEMNANDVEAKLELAKALTQLGRSDDALEQLKAAIAVDPTRADIALELARTYEAAGRTDDAAKAYSQLLAAKDVSVAARARAGRFLARTGHIDQAVTQADPILAAEPDNAAGHYLKGEGLLAAGKLDEARRELQVATDADPDPQYLDAQGRAGEASEAATGDTKYYDYAVRAYQRAADADPKLFNPQAGMGRVYVAQRAWDKAIAPLQAANKLDPTNPQVMYELGLDAKNLSQPKVAIQWLEKAMAAAPTGEGYDILGGLYFDTNAPPQAARAYEKATVLGLADEKKGAKVDWLTEAYYWAGRVHMDMHDEPAAVRPWRIYVQRNPTDKPHADEVHSALATQLRNY
ncbi:MAG TPA: tetratricopeptide repeat protein [Kofleriaceae bacterium]|jgi:tetratricopeptide (TPR) repeat protein